MPIRFDPYHKWLGIPQSEQPAHHYRLLGVQLLESDPDVISNAADQRMSLLKSFANSKYSSLAQDLLNEVSRARVCLLNPAKKQAYDGTLRGGLGAEPSRAHEPRSFWLPPRDRVRDTLVVSCLNCETDASYVLQPLSQLLPCKSCHEILPIPSREEVVAAATRLTRKAATRPDVPSNPCPNENSSTAKSRVTQQAFPQSSPESSHVTYDNEPQFAPLEISSIPDRQIVLHRRKKSTRSPLVFLFSVIVGGLAGLAAGYFVLCQIDLRFDFLHLMSAESDNTRPQEKSDKSIPTPRPFIPKVQRPAKPRLHQNLPIQVSSSVHQPNDGDVPIVTRPDPPPARPAPKDDVPIADLPVMLDKPSAIVTLNLDKPVIHIIAESDKTNDVLCDVAFSHNLLHRGDTRHGYELVAKGLVNHKKETVELGANIQGAGAAIEIKVTRQNNVVRCDLRPLFSLPSGDIHPLTITHGTTLHNKLSKSLAAARAARDSLPAMRSTLSQLQSALRTAQRAMSANGSSPADTGAGRTAAMIQANNLNGQVNALNRKLAAAEKLAAQEPVISKDLQSLNEIAEYAKGIASVATVSVRFHVGNTTIAATAK